MPRCMMSKPCFKSALVLQPCPQWSCSKVQCAVLRMSLALDSCFHGKRHAQKTMSVSSIPKVLRVNIQGYVTSVERLAYSIHSP